MANQVELKADVLVVGGGLGGVSAGLYCRQSRRDRHTGGGA